MRTRTDRIEWTTRWAGFFLILTATAVLGVARGQQDRRAELEGEFTQTVRPFLKTYCIGCHGRQKPAAQMDLSGFTTMTALMRDGRRWSQMLERLEAEEMPPKGARHPTQWERRAAVDWFHAVREHEMRRNAGDPGVVLARRLSNAEYNYTVRDLTGVDIRPTREFPVDPANTAGFDNSGETLMMSPTLLKKYLAAAREVASHMYLKEEGFAFAPQFADFEAVFAFRRLDLEQAVLDFREFVLDPARAFKGGVSRRPGEFEGTFLASRRDAVVDEESLQEQRGVDQQDSVREQGVVGDRDNHLRAGRQQSLGIAQPVAGVDAGRREQRPAADVEVGAVVAEDDHRDANTADPHPGGFLDTPLDLILDLEGDGAV